MSEIGWLIELKGSAPSWAILNPHDYDEHWTEDSTKAIRFARRQDAQAYIDHIGWTEAFPSEHIWDDGERALASSTPAESAGGGVQFPPRPSGHVSIAHDGFAGDIIGHYETREGKRGVVVQQDGTRVVHVYGEKWLTETDATRARGEAVSASGVEAHPDDVAVDRFAAAMKVKLAMKRAEGYRGWENKEDCTAGRLSFLLRDHVDKGDPVDVGNLAMMLHQRGQGIAASPSPPETREGAIRADEREACAQTARAVGDEAKERGLAKAESRTGRDKANAAARAADRIEIAIRARGQ